MMAKPELGTKRLCTECGAKFYDLNRDPMSCPKCGATFDVASLTLMRQVTAKPREKPEAAPAAEEEVIEEDLVALEEADAEEEDTGRAATEIEEDDVPDLEEDETIGDGGKADEFLEDEEEDDDVSALIEGDIEDEED